MPARHLTRSQPADTVYCTVATDNSGRHLSAMVSARLMLLLLLILPAQSSGVITFERTWSWYGNNAGYTVLQTREEGYVIGAHIQTGPDDHFMAVIGTDSVGDTLWATLFQDWWRGYCCPVSGGAFVVAGDTFDNDWGHLVVAAKLDKTGELIWRNKYFISASVISAAAAPARDGGIVVTGVFDDALGTHLGLLKVDSCGEATWYRTYSAPGQDAALGYSVVQTRDCGYAICGLLCDTLGDSYTYLVRTDSLGDTLWTRMWSRWREYKLYEGQSIVETEDGGYVVTGDAIDTTHHTRRPMIMRLDSSGDLRWIRVYQDFAEGYCIRQTQDKGYVVVGGAENRRAACLTKTDSLGTTLWTRRFVPPFTNYACAAWVESTADRGYVLVGQAGPDYSNVYLIKTDSLGIVEVGLTEEPSSVLATCGVQVSPNPCIGKATVSVLGRVTEPFTLGIHDTAGRLLGVLAAGRQPTGAGAAVWDCTDDAGRSVPAGVYLVSMVVRGRVAARTRLVLLR